MCLRCTQHDSDCQLYATCPPKRAVSSFNDPETRNGFYKSDTDDVEEYSKKLHNTTKEPTLKYKMRQLKRLMEEEEEAAKKKKAEEAKK